MILYQIFVIFFVAAGIHGIDPKECNFDGQLKDHYLEAAYLHPNNSLLFRGQVLGTIKQNNGERIKIDESDAVRIEKEKFVLLGYEKINSDFHRLVKVMVVGLDENGKPKQPFEKVLDHSPDHHFINKAYYIKEENAIYIDSKQKYDLVNRTVSAGTGKQDCFGDTTSNQRHCVYDPYNNNFIEDEKVVTVSCGFKVYKESIKKSKVKDAGTNYFCLAEDAKYKKTFLFPNSTIYGEKCENGLQSETVKNEPPRTPDSPAKPKNEPQLSMKNPNALDTECQDMSSYWYGAGAAFGVFVLILIAGLFMIVIERRGKGKKQAYMRLQKMLKKDEPSAYTTMTQTQTTMTQDEGGRSDAGTAKSDVGKSDVGKSDFGKSDAAGATGKSDAGGVTGGDATGGGGKTQDETTNNQSGMNTTKN